MSVVSFFAFRRASYHVSEEVVVQILDRISGGIRLVLIFSPFVIGLSAVG